MKQIGMSLLALALSADMLATDPCTAVVLTQGRYASVQQYDLENLANVDMSRKRLFVNVAVSSDPATGAFRAVQKKVLKKVSDFYSAYGVDVTYVYPPFLPESTNTITLMVVDKKKLPFDCKGFVGCFFQKERIAFYGIDRNDKEYAMKNASWIINQYWRDIGHEFGHGLGLYHVGVLKNSRLHEVHAGVQNLMMDADTGEGDTSSAVLEPAQVQIIHSFLAEGQAYWARQNNIQQGIDMSEYMCHINEALDARATLNRSVNCTK